MMWVWDGNKSCKVKRKVLYILNDDDMDIDFPVVTLYPDEKGVISYRYCAEIEKPKARRMTRQELSWWLRSNPTREYKHINDMFIYSYFSYTVENAACPVDKDILIREDGGEWHKPLVEENT